MPFLLRSCLDEPNDQPTNITKYPFHTFPFPSPSRPDKSPAKASVISQSLQLFALSTRAPTTS